MNRARWMALPVIAVAVVAAALWWPAVRHWLAHGRLMHTFLLFFSWPSGGAWSNIIAVPPCAVLAAALAFIFRDRLGRAISGWHKRHLGHGRELAEIRDLAARAHRIAADTYRHHAGHDHPDAAGGDRGAQA